ncbi:zinc-binding alcohol dehydrogenase [Caldithrix abyssi]|nr:zinc-binding alcohol dehydrogenase [Caldithrix abyssi]
MTKAFWILGKGKSAIKKEILPDLKTGWCELETIFSSISPGTEQLIYNDYVPKNIYEDMACHYMGGMFPYPVKYGYSLVGKVVNGPENLMGKLVHILHPHQDCCRVRLEDTYLLPENLPAKRAILASNLESAVTAIWDSQVSIGDRVLVVGFGIIGSLVARLLSFIADVQVEIADVNPKKIELAKQMGFKACFPDEASKDFDLAFHSSGKGEGLRTAIEKVGYEGKIIELSWYGSHRISIDLGETFHSQRKSIISSQVSHIPSNHLPRWNILRRKQTVFSLLLKSEFDRHITHTVMFEELPSIFLQLNTLSSEGLAFRVKY